MAIPWNSVSFFCEGKDRHVLTNTIDGRGVEFFRVNRDYFRNGINFASKTRRQVGKSCSEALHRQD
jgi:hypothetical protein